MDVMNDSYFGGSHNALQYYVNKAARGVVKAAYEKWEKNSDHIRPSIEIIDLEEWLLPSTTPK
jgi:hypothetical protein